MFRLAVRASFISLLCIAIASPAMAQRPPRKGPTGKATKWIVIQVADELKTLDAKELKSLQKQTAVEHKEAVKAWSEAKKAAKKSKEKFTDKKPVKPKVAKLAGPFKTEAEAEKALNQHRAKRSGKAATKPTKGSWIVVDVGGERKVLQKTQVGAFKKDLAAEHKAAVSEWQKSKAAAKKAKEKFTTPKPAKKSMKDLRKSFPTEAEAQEWASKNS